MPRVRTDPLTGKEALRAVRTTSRFHMHGQSSPPQFQYLRLPRVGNVLGALTLRLPSALTTTVQSSIVEIYVSVVIDGVPHDVEVEVEDFYWEPVYE